MSSEISPRKKTTITTKVGGKDVVVRSPTEVKSSSGRVVSGGNKADVVFVFDTTASMDNEIHGLLETCKSFVDEAHKIDLDLNFALIAFGDISVRWGRDTIELVVPLTDSVEQMKHGLSHIPRNNGFGNRGETCLEAIHEAFKIDHREDAVKVMVVITDEPAHQHNYTAEEVISKLATREYLVFVIAIDEPYYKEMARRNGGVWKEIGPHTKLSEILEMFSEMAKKVSEAAKEVHLLGGGSVKKYLQLKPPEDD